MSVYKIKLVLAEINFTLDVESLATALAQLSCCHFLKGNKKKFQQSDICCREALLQQRKISESIEILKMYYIFSFIILNLCFVN